MTNASAVQVAQVHAGEEAVPQSLAACQSEPVLIKGASGNWRHIHHWLNAESSHSALSRMVPLEYSVRAIYIPDKRLNGGLYQRKISSLSNALVLMKSESVEVNYYLSAVNLRRYIPELFSYLSSQPLFGNAIDFRSTLLFIGGAGTGTHPHYDIVNSFLAVSEGRKRIVMIHPDHMTGMRPYKFWNSLSHFSTVNPGEKGWLVWLNDQKIPYRICEVAAGEIAFIPAYWWHVVFNIEHTIGVTHSYNVPWTQRDSWRHFRVFFGNRIGPRLNALCDLYRSCRPTNADVLSNATSIKFPDNSVNEKPMRPTHNDNQAHPEKVSLDYVLNHARLTEQLGFAESAVRAYIVDREATRRGLVASDEALQTAADAYRLIRHLHSAEDTGDHLQTIGLSAEDFEEKLRLDVIEGLVRTAVTETHIDELIAQSPELLETVSVSRIRHEDEGVTQEIRVIIQDGEQDFHALARQCCQDAKTAMNGGYLGEIDASKLPSQIRQSLGDAEPGTVFEPVFNNDAWELYKVEKYTPPAMDPATRERASSLLFERWLTQQRAGIELERITAVPDVASD